MINVKSAAEIQKMRNSAAIMKDTFKLVEDTVRAGITTAHLDKVVYDYILKRGAAPSFLHYNGYPATICASIDEVVVHGIPSGRVLEPGQIIGIDIGVFFEGYHSDCARTYAIGMVSATKQKLIEVAESSFFKGVDVLKSGVRLGDLSSAIQQEVEKNNFSVIREMVGHGIGAMMHEDPQVPNFGNAGRGVRLQSGMALAIEPMISAGDWRLNMLTDGWTVETVDKSPSAHYENTVIITDDGAEILTL